MMKILRYFEETVLTSHMYGKNAYRATHWFALGLDLKTIQCNITYAELIKIYL